MTAAELVAEAKLDFPNTKLPDELLLRFANVILRACKGYVS